MTTPYFQLTAGSGLKILYGGRTVVDTAGSLVLGLPAANDYVATGVAMNFPDFTKQWLYNWRYSALCTNNVGPTFTLTERGTSYIGAQPGTTTTTTILATAPAGCNAVFGLVRINRTNTPSTWNLATILVKPSTNVWIPINGSIVVEEQPGMSRKFSLVISGGNLVLVTQQSVSTPPFWAVSSFGAAAGIRTYAYCTYSTYPNFPGFGVVGTTYSGGEWALQTEGVPYYPCFNLGEAVISGSGQTSNDLSARRTTANGFVGANAHTITDTTNYASNYTLDINVKFCKAA